MFLDVSRSDVHVDLEHSFFARLIGRVNKNVRLKSRAPRKKFVRLCFL